MSAVVDIEKAKAELAARAQQPRMQTSMVEVIGTLPNGEQVKQVVPVNHPMGADDGTIMGYAWGFVKQVGALLVENSGGIDYYILVKFEKLYMSVNRVSLVGPA